MQTELLKIAGMSCGGCTGKVADALKAVPGVGGVNVLLSAGEATVQYDEQLTSLEQLKAAVKDAGYRVDTADSLQKSQGNGGCCCR